MKLVQPKNVPFSTVSHSRASTGTYIDSFARFRQAGTNALRISYDRDTQQFAGVLIEPRRTNLFRNTLSSVSGDVLTPASLPTQSISTSSYVAMTISFYGSGSITATSGGYTQVIPGSGADVRTYYTINCSGKSTITFTVSGQVYAANCEGFLFGQLPSPTTTDDEEYSYCRPTSWIPTTSSTATREADVLDGYGVIYSDFADINSPYNPATTYATDDRVVYENNVYQSLIDGNIGNTPGESPTAWVFVQTGNKFAMFDLEASYVSTATTGAIAAIRMPPGVVTSTTLLEMSANSDLLGQGSLGDELLDNVIAETVIYRSDRQGGPDIVSGYTGTISGAQYLSDGERYQHFGGIEADIISFRLTTPSQYVVGEWEPYDVNSSVTIGEVVVGLERSIGTTLVGVRSTFDDFSLKSTDQFGFTVFTERGYSKRCSIPVDIDNDDQNDVLKTIYSVRAKPTVFIAEDDSKYYEAGLIFGYMRDFNLVIPYTTHSTYSIEIEGLVI